MRKLILCLIILIAVSGCSNTVSNQSEVMIETEYIYDESMTYSDAPKQLQETEEAKIFGRKSASYSYQYEIDNPKVIMAEARSVVHVLVKDVGTARFDDALGFQTPITPIEIELIEVISGETIDTDTIYAWGGDVTIREVIEVSPDSITVKRGFVDISEEEKDNYLRFESDVSVGYELGKAYVLTLDKQDNGLFTITGEGYGTFEIEPVNPRQRNSKLQFRNVITQKTIQEIEIP